jgi:hypothetical protein
MQVFFLTKWKIIVIFSTITTSTVYTEPFIYNSGVTKHELLARVQLDHIQGTNTAHITKTNTQIRFYLWNRFWILIANFGVLDWNVLLTTGVYNHILSTASLIDT